MTIKNRQQSGANSTNLQADNIVINNKSVVLYSVEELAKQLINSSFGELPEETKKQIKNNQTSYFQYLSEELKKIKKQSEEVKLIVDTPDFQYASRKALISASKSSSTELHKILSSLIIERINSNNEELKRIVYNEAIKTVEKLTINQLKIITLCCLLKEVHCTNVISWEIFNGFLNNHIKPFLKFKNTYTEFTHINYTGCGNMVLIRTDPFHHIKARYSILFLNLIERRNIDDLNLPNELKKNIVTLDLQQEKYRFRFQNQFVLEQYLKKHKVDENIIKSLTSFYETHLKDNDTVKKIIMEKAIIGKELLELFESNFNYLNLTSVGIAIGISYFRKITGQTISPDIWIN